MDMPIAKSQAPGISRPALDAINETMAHSHANGTMQGGDGMTAIAGAAGNRLIYNTTPPAMEFSFWAQITPTGPQDNNAVSLPDFTDARYWVQATVLLQGAADYQNAINNNLSVTSTLVNPQLDASALTQWMVATNLQEIAAGTHMIQAGTNVYVTVSYGVMPDAGYFPYYQATFSFSVPSAMKGASLKALIKANGGSDGTSSTYASWTYDVYALADTGYVKKLNTSGAVNPKCSRARIIIGPVTAATDGSVADCYYDTTGAVQIFDLQEFHGKQACS